MNKFYSILFLFSFFLILSCDSDDSISSGTPKDSIVLSALSMETDTLDFGESQRVYFAFTASEYITQTAVNLRIFNESNGDATGSFTVSVTPFSEKETTLAEQLSSFTISPKATCLKGRYTVALDVLVGTEKDTKTITLVVGKPAEVIVGLKPSYSLAEDGTDTIEVSISCDDLLTVDDFSVTMEKANPTDITPLVKVLSFSNNYVTIELDAYHAQAGIYKANLSINGARYPFSIVITEGDTYIPPVYSFKKVTTKGELKSGNEITFLITLLNEGGDDSVGHYVFAEMYEKQIGFKKTDVTKAGATTTVEIPWKSVAGDHSFYFTVEKASGDTSTVPEVAKLDVSIEINKHFQKESKVVTESEKESIIDALFGSQDNINTIFEEIDDKIADASDENVKHLLETVKLVADQGMKVSSSVNPIKVTYDDPRLKAIHFPLSKMVDSDEVFNTTTFLITVGVLEDIIIRRAIINGESIATKKEEIETIVPFAFLIKEAPEGSLNKYSEIVVQNSLGGFSIGAESGDITLLAGSASSGFWTTLKVVLSEAAKSYNAVVINPASTQKDIYMASIVFVNEIVNVMKAYELQTDLRNDPPNMIVTPSIGTEEYRQGNDLFRITRDIFIATVFDDKPGASIQGSFIFDPGPIGGAHLENKTHIFIAQDSDGETDTSIVTSVYNRQIYKNHFTKVTGL